MRSIKTLNKTNVVSFFALSLCFFSCKRNQDIQAFIYKKDSKIKELHGSFYSTKYGGLNYYISNSDERNGLFKIQDIDSIIFLINTKTYNAEPLIMKSFSKEKKDSDFSFSIDEKDHKIVVDTINNMSTLSIFSAKTNIEEMKDKKNVKFTLIVD